MSRTHAKALGLAARVIGIRCAVLNKYDNTVDVRALRYRRAVRMVFEKNRFFGGLRFSKMVGLKSSELLEPQSQKSFREVGIVLEQYFVTY